MEKLQGVLGAASRGGVRSMAVTNPLGIDLDQYKYGFHDPEDTYAFKSRKGLDREIVEMISHMKSEPVYHSLREEWTKLGVVFLDMDSALREHPDLVKEYFGTVIPPEDNKFAALNSSVWSGGSFVYVPAGVHVDIPLQAYFRINAQ